MELEGHFTKTGMFILNIGWQLTVSLLFIYLYIYLFIYLFILLYLKTRKRFLQVIFKNNKQTIYIQNNNNC